MFMSNMWRSTSQSWPSIFVNVLCSKGREYQGHYSASIPYNINAKISIKPSWQTNIKFQSRSIELFMTSLSSGFGAIKSTMSIKLGLDQSLIDCALVDKPILSPQRATKKNRYSMTRVVLDSQMTPMAVYCISNSFNHILSNGSAHQDIYWRFCRTKRDNIKCSGENSATFCLNG